MKPTIGRKVWLWVNSGMQTAVRDNAQAIDATVIFVNPEGTIDVDATDHQGQRWVTKNLELRDPTGDEEHDPFGSVAPYCTWMPYQVQVDKERQDATANKTPASKK